MHLCLETNNDRLLLTCKQVSNKAPQGEGELGFSRHGRVNVSKSYMYIVGQIYSYPASSQASASRENLFLVQIWLVLCVLNSNVVVKGLNPGVIS